MPKPKKVSASRRTVSDNGRSVEAHPDGHLIDVPLGEVMCSVAVDLDAKCICVEFTEPTLWFRMSQETAFRFARAITKKACMFSHDGIVPIRKEKK